MDLVSSLGAIRMVWLIKQVTSGIAKLPKELTALIVAAVAFVNYSALYYVYFQFYVSFGLRPSDVGLYHGPRMLQESLLGVLLLPYTLAARHPDRLLAIVLGALLVRLLYWRFIQSNRRASIGATIRAERRRLLSCCL